MDPFFPPSLDPSKDEALTLAHSCTSAVSNNQECQEYRSCNIYPIPPFPTDMNTYLPFCNSFNPLLTMSTHTPPAPFPLVCEPLHPESSLFSIQPFTQYLVSLSMDEGQGSGGAQPDTYMPFVSHGYTAKTDSYPSLLAFLIFLQFEGQYLLEAFTDMESRPFEPMRVSYILNTFAGYQECLRRAWSRLMRALHGNTPIWSSQAQAPVKLSLNSLLPHAPGTSLTEYPSSHTAFPQSSRIPRFRNLWLPREHKKTRLNTRVHALQLSERIPPTLSTPPTIINLHNSLFQEPPARQYSINSLLSIRESLPCEFKNSNGGKNLSAPPRSGMPGVPHFSVLSLLDPIFSGNEESNFKPGQMGACTHSRHTQP